MSAVGRTPHASRSADTEGRHGVGGLALLTVALLTAGSLLGSSAWRWGFAAALAATLVVALRRRDERATALAAVGLLVVGTIGAFVSSVWIAALAAGLALLAAPALRDRVTWFRVGQIDRTVGAVMLATVAVATVALSIWATAQPRLDREGASLTLGEPTVLDRLIDQAQQIPWWLFPLAALAFALLNSAAEELVYRGIVLDALLPTGAVAIALQAIAFGAIHLHGFPSGWWGVAMATVYGAALGWLRIRSGGIAAPFLVHVGADVVIAYLVRFGFGYG
jgi:membrane protease YdiL (CAAX protease family)